MREVELPDFDDMYSLAKQIHEKTLKSKLLKIELDAAENLISKTATENSTYFINGKPPSATHIKSTYLFSGFDGELIDKRKELAELETDVEYFKLVMDLHRSAIEVWRTQSANKRKAID